jgi:hypothetical protein
MQLSPNLRKRTREAQMAILSNELFLLKDIEIKKLEKLLGQVWMSSLQSRHDFFPYLAE